MSGFEFTGSEKSQPQSTRQPRAIPCLQANERGAELDICDLGAFCAKRRRTRQMAQGLSRCLIGEGDQWRSLQSPLCFTATGDGESL